MFMRQPGSTQSWYAAAAAAGRKKKKKKIGKRVCLNEGTMVSNYNPEIVSMFTPRTLHAIALLLWLSATSVNFLPPLSQQQKNQKENSNEAFCFTHRPRLKVLFLQSPLLAVEVIVLHILQHHLVFRVEQQVAGCARSSVLYIVHCEKIAKYHVLTLHYIRRPVRSGCLCRASYIYSRKTGGSDTWWLQTSPRRSPRRWVSAAPHISPDTSAHQCRDLRETPETK